MVDPRTRFEELMGKLREREYRLTPQRVALLRLLAASDGHTSAFRGVAVLTVGLSTCIPWACPRAFRGKAGTQRAGAW